MDSLILSTDAGEENPITFRDSIQATLVLVHLRILCRGVLFHQSVLVDEFFGLGDAWETISCLPILIPFMVDSVIPSKILGKEGSYFIDASGKGVSMQSSIA